MSSALIGLAGTYSLWKGFQWMLSRSPTPSNPDLESLSPEDWIKQTDILVMLFTLEFYTRKNAKEPCVQKLEEQRKKVEGILDKLRTLLLWKNDGWKYAYRSWHWTGEQKLFKKVKEEHAILVKRMALLKQFEK